MRRDELRSLVIATDIDVLPPGVVITEHEDYLVVRSPGNPSHYFGNFLVFAHPPGPGDHERWERCFAREFADEPRVRHVCLAWDTVDGELGAARAEFEPHGFVIEEGAGLVAEPPSRVRAHAREHSDVVIRELDPAEGADEEAWAAVIELQVANREEGHREQDHRIYCTQRMRDRRTMFREGRGGWFGAWDPASGALTASCGIVVTHGRGRYQAVDTDERWRRLGICSRLVVEVARAAERQYGATRLVMAADRNYHALGLYRSLGFEPAEEVATACWWPTAPRAELRIPVGVG